MTGWQLVAMSEVWPPNIFPSPYDVLEDLVYMAGDGSLFHGIGTSLWRLATRLCDSGRGRAGAWAYSWPGYA